MNTTSRRIYVNNDLDIVVARMQAREMAKKLGFGTVDQARISLATSELARVLSWNSHQAEEIILSDADQNGHRGIQVVCFVNIEYVPGKHGSDSTKANSIPTNSLTGACQLVDESIVEEQDDNRARITLIKWLK